MAQERFDKVTYNPEADPAIDEAEYRPPRDPDTEDIAVGARGAINEPTNMDAATEDAAAARSEESGTIPRREVEGLIKETSEEERSKLGTRGKKVDFSAEDAVRDATLERI